MFRAKVNKVLFLLTLMLSMSAFSATNMTGVEFNSLPGGQVELMFAFDGEVPEPQIYTIEKPARIALDLDGVSSKLKQKKHTLDLGNTQSVVVVESGGRTRVIVNLVELTKYESRIEDGHLIVVVGNDGVRDYLVEAPSSAVEQAADASDVESVINSLDFRRGDDGEGRLLIQLSNPNIDVDSRLEGSIIKLSFSGAELPEELRLSYDVSDFATPVLGIDARQEAGTAMIELKATGEYEYLAYQAENTYVLSVKPLTEDEIEAKKKEFAYVGDKLSLNFQDIDVRAVLQLIADFTDLNLVASDTVSGKITLRLQNVPWDQALDLILKTKGLDKRMEGNVLMVAPAAEIAAREEQEIKTNQQLEELAPLQTEFIRIRYANAADIFALLQGQAAGEAESSGAIMSSRATVVVDERTNSLLVTETAAKLEEIRRLINLIDVPIKQVMIEARIVIASSDDSESIGIQWTGGERHTSSNGDRYILSDSQDTFDGLSAFDSGTDDTIQYDNIVDLGACAGEGCTSFNLGFLDASALRFVNLQISAFESAGKAETVSQPKIVTADKQAAVIKSGQQIAYQESSANGGTTTSFQDATLTLEVTPSITPDDRVIMDLIINQDSIGDAAANGVPTIDTTELQTQVLVGNGETVVLGGIFQTLEQETVSKTPFFGDIPYIGRLFRRTVKSLVKTETLIFITPRILADTLVE